MHIFDHVNQRFGIKKEKVIAGILGLSVLVMVFVGAALYFTQ